MAKIKNPSSRKKCSALHQATTSSLSITLDTLSICMVMFQKNPRAHKNKIGTPPPKKPKKRGILWTWVFLQRKSIFPGVHKIDAPISGPRIADKNFTDTDFSECWKLSKTHGTPCRRVSLPGAFFLSIIQISAIIV